MINIKLDVIGKSITRVDGLSKVTGKAIYPQDIYMENMLFGKTLRSTKPHAKINIDIREAEKLDGVIKIITYVDVPKNNHGVVFKDHEVLCSEKVRRVGDPIAFVVAQSEKIAKKAIDLIEVHYEELEAVFNPKKAMEENSPKVHGDNNLLYHYKLNKGDIDESFLKCDIVVENEYVTSMVDHAFLQPEAGISYIDEDGMLNIIASTQYPHFDRLEVSEALNFEVDKVRIINPAVGGAFGGREDITVQIHLALATIITKRPVKVVYDRKESFLAHSKRHPITMKYKTGSDKNGKLLALEAEIIGDTGAYASWAINVMRKAGVHATGPYDIPNVKVDSYAVYTNNPFAGAMRGFGATQVAMAYEQQMDIIANKLNINPFELRRINMFRLDSKTATGQVLHESVPLKSCLDAIENKMEIKKSKLNNKKIGRGISCSFYGTGYGNGFPDISKAEAKLKKDGKVYIYVGATEVGQGAKTILTQIGAETIGLNCDDVIIINEDTSITPDSGTAAASRQTYNSGNAVKIACEKLRNNIIEASKDELKLNTDIGINIKNGTIYLKSYPNKNITLKEIANKFDSELTSEGIFIAKTTEMDSETGQGAPYWPYTFGACGVTVEVDTNTGLVEIIESVVAQDVGKAINPSSIEGQIDGGFSMALGYTLMEDLNLVKGVIKNNRFTNYLIPTSLDMPEIHKIIIEDPESSAPYGAKGIGEPVMIPVTPAILNAIYDATGVRMTEIPVTPDKLLKELKKL